MLPLRRVQLSSGRYESFSLLLSSSNANPTHGANLQLSLFSLLARELSDILEQIWTKDYSATFPSTAVMEPVICMLPARVLYNRGHAPSQMLCNAQATSSKGWYINRTELLQSVSSTCCGSVRLQQCHNLWRKATGSQCRLRKDFQGNRRPENELIN